jgi:putative membrane protein
LQLLLTIRDEEHDMRPTTYLSIAAVAATFALGAPAQTRTPAPEPQKQPIVTAEAPQEAARGSKTPAQLEFLVAAFRTSLAEARIGELATQQSHDQRVRNYGAKLESDHTAHAAELERMLEPLGVAIPTEPSAEALSHHAALARLSGEEFDAAFIQMMIWSHTDAIERYGAQTHANPDRALHDFAAATLPMLREHLAAAEALR